MSHLNYPLRFQPVLKQYIWGGRRLESMLGKHTGKDEDFAESWEIVDHRDGQSVVQFGPHSGMSLGDLVLQLPEELLGEHTSSGFPLLFKFLDANSTLSVQVHPDDLYASRLTPPDLGKTEAWVVIHADPDSVLYAGLNENVTRDDLAAALENGSVERLLNKIPVSAGDCVFIPAGTVHALGEGLLIAEIQQASNTTFRLFDWNRLGTDGKARELHVEQSLQVTDFQCGPVQLQQPIRIDEHREVLVDCEKFVMERWRVSCSEQLDFGCHGQFQIVAVLYGSVQLSGDVCEKPLSKGETCLFPAACDNRTAVAENDSVLLVIR